MPTTGPHVDFELPETGTSHEFKQWAVDGSSWVWSDQDAQYVEAHPATGQWHFQSVEEWAEFLG